MESVVAFVTAIVLLLAVPGPTNTLLFMAGATSGIERSLKLLLAEAAGYMSVVLPVSILAAPLLEESPAIAGVIKFAAALWVLYMSVKLWFRGSGASRGAVVPLPTMFVTTLLNPKALIVGLVIMPHGPPTEVLPWAAAFLVALVAIALGWISAGALTRLAPPEQRVLPLLCRVAAVCLVIFSGLMMSSAVSSL